MSKSIYLINPASDFPTYYGAEVYAASGLRPATCVADLAAPTVAAMVPDDFDTRLCDENLTPIDFDADVDYVAITGKTSQARRMFEVARECRARGRTVVIGGPFASLSPEVAREYCDVLVRGEIEEIQESLFADLRQGRCKSEYVGTKPSLDLSPVPRWDLYPNDRTEWAALQTSRGCPFSCEFCDVIAYLGRKQRHKPIANVLRELDALYTAGYRNVFLADDNLTVYRSRAKELLAAIAEWNDRRDRGRVHLATQVSIDTARDDELLRLCAEAGLCDVFIGLETPNEESLKDAKKNQNVGVDLPAQVRRFQEHGIMVVGGMIVGFDADGLGIFEQQRAFATKAALPIVTLGALTAPPATPLYARMKAAGRLVENSEAQVIGTPWDTNMIPAGMTRAELFEGTRWLARELYAPAAFGERMLRCIAALGARRDGPAHAAHGRAPERDVDRDCRAIIEGVAAFGPAEADMVRRIMQAVQAKPQTAVAVGACLRIYAQIRHMWQKARLFEPVAA